MIASRPKICILTETYYPIVGGGETQARVLAEGLIVNGLSVVILTRRSDPSLTKVEHIGSTTVYRLSPTGRGHLKKWGLLLTALPALVALRRQYDIVFVSGFRVLGIAAVLISKLLGKGCVLKADSLGEMSGDFFKAGLAKLHVHPSSWTFRAFLCLRNWVLRKADAFVAISSPVAEELEMYGIGPKDIYRIPNGVDTRHFCPVEREEKHSLRQKLGISPSVKVVVYTGRLVSYKGLPLLVRVWRELHQQHPDVQLLLVGSGGLDTHNCEAELKAYVATNGLQDSIRFTGDVHNVHEYLQASDIFVFPTESEAFGISLIEAMACGLPVISTPVGGVKDILQHGHSGLVVEPGDFERLYDTLDLLITDHSLSVRLGRSARQTVCGRYSTDFVIQEYIRLFGKVSHR